MEGFSSLWSDTGSSLEKVVWSFFIGIVIAALLLWYNRRVIGAVVRALNYKKVHTPEEAKTLDELGLNNFFIRNALKKSDSVLRKSVYTDCEKEKLKTEDFKTVKFYIPKELRNQTHFKYRSKNTSLPIIIIFVIVMFAVAVLAIELIPKLLDMIPEEWRGR